MAQTDSVLKLLIDDFIVDFAGWILNEPVRAGKLIKTELPHPITADNVSQVTLADGRDLLLHVEFQGARSDPPIARRMLDYMVRLTAKYELPVASVVIYVGRQAGANDPGHHTQASPIGVGSLSWQYQVLRLWELDADDLLSLEQPALAALVGQTRISQPETTFTEAVRQIKTVPDKAQQQRLTLILTSLIDKELVNMVEKMLHEEDFLWELPFAQIMQERGIEKGIEKGIAQGELNTLQRTIMRIITTRFALAETDQQAIKSHLTSITTPAELDTLLDIALTADSFAAFQTALKGA